MIFKKRKKIQKILKVIMLIVLVAGLICFCSYVFTDMNTEAESVTTEEEQEVVEDIQVVSSDAVTIESTGTPTAGVTTALNEIIAEANEEAEQQAREEEKLRKQKEKEEKKKEAERKKKEEEERKYKEAHPHYEVYDPTDGEWHHMDFDLQDHLKNLCDENNITEYFPLLLVQLYCESGYKSNLVSSTGDYGIAQINECNHSSLRKQLGVTDFLDPYQSIECNVFYMAQFLKDYPPNQALSKYNTGQAYNSTPYSRKVLGRYNDGQGVRLIDV